MEQNVGNTDRILRAVIGAILVVLGLAAFGGALKFIALLVGVVLLATAAMSRCPAYNILGIKSSGH